MPYTKTELETVDFYQEFVSKLRTSYLEDLQEFATIGFRRNNILYSFEDIISSNGIEEVDIAPGSQYHSYVTKEQQELSKTTNTQSYPRYIKNNSLERIVDRSISEFKKVFTFSDSNKLDDAQFKMGLCYMNIGKIDEAIIEFKKLLDSYPSSEYYVRAKNYINQY